MKRCPKCNKELDPLEACSCLPLTVKSFSQKPRTAPNLPCSIIDRFDLPKKNNLIQVECLYCHALFLEGGDYPCLVNMNESEKQQKLEPATRYDAGKIPYHLFPLDAFEEICKVMQFGAKKYAERNWEQGMSWSRVARSMFSHFIAMCRGEQNDEESNLPHAAHMAWNAIVLLAYTLRPKLHSLNDLSHLYSGTKE